MASDLMQHSDKFSFYKWCRQSQKNKVFNGWTFEKLIGNNTTIADYINNTKPSQI